MNTLSDILVNVSPVKTTGDAGIAIRGLAIDSRVVSTGYVFIAVRGTLSDGHTFIEKAIGQGATVIVCEDLPVQVNESITYVQVKDSAEAAGLMADAFFGFPSSRLQVVGITGTNGKTTTATLLYQLFEQAGNKCGLISTVQNQIHDKTEIATHTTPDSISIHALLARMVDAGCTYAFMEVSSHAVHQRRIAGVRFAGGVFTNITHDHLDYHKTFDEYIRVKKSFFDGLPSGAFALTNMDDKRGLVMIQNTKAERHTYSLQAPGEIKGKVLENSISGLLMIIDNVEAHFRMIGTFNAYNLLAVYGSAKLLGMDKITSLAILSKLTGAPGRFETYLSATDKIMGIVDYAHTPDALVNVLATINQLRQPQQQLITVIGCGGDRDRTKRPIMAQVACKHSTMAILTSDNPRSEDPESILNEMEEGLKLIAKKRYLRITDRREAIKVACTLAQPGDIVLVAGKGHETYQEIKGVKHHFDDREILKETFETLNK
jgi:UDP-N-acetylmuramoyl-L-alanyl-D-glutamate--2,6-diaminopimelate ligase